MTVRSHAKYDGVLRSFVEAGKPATLFFSNGIGDFVLALPALRALQSIFPDSLTLLAGRDTPRFLTSGLQFASIEFIEAPMLNGRRQVLEFGAPSTTDELFVSIVPWYNETLGKLVASRRPALTIGHSRAYDLSVPLLSSVHASDTVFQFSRLFEPRLRIGNFAYAVKPSNAAIEFATALRAHLAPERFVIVIHLETANHKCVPVEWASALLRALSTLPGLECLVIGRDRSALPEDAPRVEVRCELESAMAVVRNADLFIGIDSCFLHVADLCHVPGVSLFVDTSALEFGYRFTQPHLNITLEKGYDGQLLINQICRFVVDNLSLTRRV